MNGTYLILIEVKRNFVKTVGSLGKINFEKGYYCYVGSAMGKSASIENRILRHLKKRKKRHWHIDYLTSSKFARVLYVIVFPSKERLEEAASNFLHDNADKTIKNFGSTDCKTKGNLHYFKSKSKMKKIIEKLSSYLLTLNKD